jgi:carbamoyltransferase
MIVLGFHGGFGLSQHEPAVALIVDGRVVAICEEERYLRIKCSYGHLPYHAIKAALRMGNVSFEDIDLIVTPGITYDGHEERIRSYLRHSFGSCPRVERIHHQKAHLATAFYGSGLDDALVVSLDATGDGACGMLATATLEHGIRVLEEIPTRNSLGYFYTLMTYYLGFIDGDEYKVMGLAPYGAPTLDLGTIVKPEGQTWKLDWSYVRSEPPLRSPFEPVYAPKLAEFLKHPARVPGSPIEKFYHDVASSTQAAFEECLLNLVQKLIRRAPGSRNLCFAGGLALNCAANRRLFYEAPLSNLYVSPVCSDRGLALGCAYLGAVELGDNPWPIWNAYWGSSYSNDEIRREIESNGCSYRETDTPAEEAARLLAEGKVIGWFQGRSEAGARALGNRSILAKPESKQVRDMVNARIKYREDFRPFAPSVLFEESRNYFYTRGADFPYMGVALDSFFEKRQEMNAVLHVDGTARIQTVRSSDNEIYYELIRNYYDQTGVPLILNTSYNLKNQPIVEAPRDALMTFYGCGLDALIMGNYVVRKSPR